MGKTAERAPQAGKPKGLSAWGKIRHTVAGAHVTDIVAGLQSQDLATRVAAAEQLHFVTGRARAEAMDVAMTALTDPVPTVRYHAIRALAESPIGRERLMPLLLSTDAAHAQVKASALADLSRLDGPDSPFEGKAVKAISYTSMLKGAAVSYETNLLRDLLRAARTAAVALPILQTATALHLAPRLYTPWDKSIDRRIRTGGYGLQIGVWPDRCCVCGTAHPAGTEELAFGGTVDTMAAAPGQTLTSSTTAEGALQVPVCAGGRCHQDPPGVTTEGLTMKFGSLEFAAELLELGVWRVYPPLPKEFPV